MTSFHCLTVIGG